MFLVNYYSHSMRARVCLWINRISEIQQLHRWFDQFQTSQWKVTDPMELHTVWSLSGHCSQWGNRIIDLCKRPTAVQICHPSVPGKPDVLLRARSPLIWLVTNIISLLIIFMIASSLRLLLNVIGVRFVSL